MNHREAMQDDIGEARARFEEWVDVDAAADLVLLSELGEAEVANIHGRACQVCSALGQMSDSAREGVERALAGTIGARKLAEILTRNGYPTGRRAVFNHQREGH